MNKADVQSVVDALTRKIADAHSQARHGDQRDAAYWNGQADAMNWTIGYLTQAFEDSTR
jgi:hypothetical protein